MDYSLSATYRSGIRIDFAVFSIFWYLLPLLMSGLVREPFSTRIKDSTAVYMVMLLPFFVLGWGNFSNRYLLPAYLATSLIVAAIFCHSRISLLRNPLLLRGGLSDFLRSLLLLRNPSGDCMNASLWELPDTPA
jgi:hypothetical protein